MCKSKYHLIRTELRKLEGQEPMGDDPYWYAYCTGKISLELGWTQLGRQNQAP